MISTATLSDDSRFGDNTFGSQPRYEVTKTEGGERWSDNGPGADTWFSIVTDVDKVTIVTNLTAEALESIAVATAWHYKSKLQERDNAEKTPNVPRICLAADALAAKLAQTEEAQMMKDVKRYYVMHPKSRWISVVGLRDRNIAKVPDWTQLIQPEGERFITALMGRTPSISIDDPGYERKATETRPGHIHAVHLAFPRSHLCLPKQKGLGRISQREICVALFATLTSCKWADISKDGDPAY
ncbi:hypothetical protein FFLO_03140 [Filobasidium floriforme]|uniref:Uncharacterized protein n=1 Tax=Filobasidium floriforme TaxID=5210 RepID=A0A8K0NQI2_9TREE|nr:uncharacterized protein HD553DRAFT_322719 [Filobasidium floriforme]KAG7548935.1 hypothetical protein FFLO_03140 [Filobasidium floriforme]KAH8088247.1 hypothetical protein HD553DRAFT_322719 [Filobasidium floriforme]